MSGGISSAEPALAYDGGELRCHLFCQSKGRSTVIGLLLSSLLMTYTASMDRPSSVADGTKPSSVTGPGISEMPPNGTFAAFPESTRPCRTGAPASLKPGSIFGFSISVQQVKSVDLDARMP